MRCSSPNISAPSPMECSTRRTTQWSSVRAWSPGTCGRKSQAEHWDRPTDYSTIAALSAVYLEDSYVLDIVDELPLFKFKIEAVLTRDHPSYRAPGSGE